MKNLINISQPLDPKLSSLILVHIPTTLALNIRFNIILPSLTEDEGTWEDQL